MPALNFILNSHGQYLRKAPEFIQNNNSADPRFAQPYGVSNLTVTVPVNVALVFYTDILNQPEKESGTVFVTNKYPGKICHGEGSHKVYPGLKYAQDLPPVVVIGPDRIVPNFMFWSDESRNFHSGLSICQNQVEINIDQLGDRWMDHYEDEENPGGNFSILLSEVLNFIAYNHGNNFCYIHILACAGGVSSEGYNNHGPGMTDATFGMKGLSLNQSFGGKRHKHKKRRKKNTHKKKQRRRKSKKKNGRTKKNRKN